MTNKKKILTALSLSTAGLAVGGTVASTMVENATSTSLNNQANPGSVVDNTTVTKPNQNVTNNQTNQNNNGTQNNVTNNSEDVYLSEKDATVSSENLKFSAVLNANSSRMSRSISQTVDMGNNSITPFHEAGFVTRTLTDGSHAEKYLTTEYYNNRTYMPILDLASHKYANERTGLDVQKDIYQGWKMSSKSTASHSSVLEYTYNATEELKQVYPNVADTVRAVDVWLGGSLEIQEMNKILAEGKYDFIIISGIDTQTSIKDFKIPEGTKKLTLKADTFDFAWNDNISVNELKIPSSVQEIEFLLGSALKSIDPTIFPANTNIISDMALASRMTSTFKEIKISDPNLTNDSDKLQNAVDAVYQYRIHERAFQGVSAGGYIGSWDLTETKVTSFNNVTIPMLNDGTGRFYIGHVEVKTDANYGPTQNETIISDKPSNDSMINSWFDHGGGWQKVNEVVVSSKQAVSIETATKEIMGFISKYSNVSKIDIKNVKLTNGSHEELVAKIKAEIIAKYGEESRYASIEFVYSETEGTIKQ